MADFDVVTAGLRTAIRTARQLQQESEAVMKRTHFRMGALIKDEAQAVYAPRSPTKNVIDKARLAAGKKKLKHRKARGVSRPKPGGLERSISMKHDADHADIFVPVNSEAGRYAFIIHEEKGNTWKNRGLGTVAKGSKADHKFLERPIHDHHDDLKKIVKDEQDQAVKKIIRRQLQAARNNIRGMTHG